MNTENTKTATAPQQGQGRMEYLSRYKGFLAALVVLIHTGITYGAVGGWMFSEPHEVIWLKVVTTCIASFSQSFVLGAFFFVSAYFLPRSLDKKGALRLLGDRLVRLGVPYALYYFLGAPLLVMAVENLGHGRNVGFRPTFNSGPLWFVEALFIFTLLYVLVRRIRRSASPLFLPRGIPAIPIVFAYIAVAAVLGFAARTAFPIGWDLHNLQLGFFPMYVLLFAAGIKAGREKCLERIAQIRLRPWAPLAVAGVVLYLPMMVAGGALEDPAPFLGGLTWQSAVYAGWEAIAGTSLFITTIVLFSRRRFGSSRLGRSFGEASYGIYLFHAFVIILVAIALVRLHVHPAVKWALLSTSGVCVPWALTAALKRVPGVRRIL